jgi:hypothetical protein
MRVRRVSLRPNVTYERKSDVNRWLDIRALVDVRSTE